MCVYMCVRGCGSIKAGLKLLVLLTFSVLKSKVKDTHNLLFLPECYFTFFHF